MPFANNCSGISCLFQMFRNGGFIEIESSLDRRSKDTWHTSARDCRPIIKAARDPVQILHPEYQVVKIFPFHANLSRLGVWVVGWPVNPTSPYPKSSMNNRTKLGRGGAGMWLSMLLSDVPAAWLFRTTPSNNAKEQPRWRIQLQCDFTISFVSFQQRIVAVKTTDTCTKDLGLDSLVVPEVMPTRQPMTWQKFMATMMLRSPLKQAPLQETTNQCTAKCSLLHLLVLCHVEVTLAYCDKTTAAWK